ncbi:hypothetical protein GCM10022419_032310 [Nonomuraea rosea]|uniref:MmyB-like transcription regulator ligand binding domain-containing protein n=1 Tax=Nonomuraea rosea TaxID=638574 RepID=A0ABP6WBJ2_9ACTN
MSPGSGRVVRSASRTSFLGLSVPGKTLAGGADWGHGDDRVRAGGAALARPRPAASRGAAGGRVRHTTQSQPEFEAALVAGLRAAAGRYPADQGLRRLVAELRAGSGRFAELWDSGAVGHHEAARKTIGHPQAGSVTLDCDVLTVTGSDLRIMVYTAEPGTEDADRLALITVLGTQSLAG